MIMMKVMANVNSASEFVRCNGGKLFQILL